MLGVRGSTPAPGPAFVRVGGHTSSVAVAHDGASPTLVLDAGTGIRNLAGVLGDGVAFRGTVVLGHLHWDHTQGLPFARALDHDEARVRLFLPEQGESAIEVLERFMSPPHFPIVPSELRGAWTIDGMVPGLHLLEGFHVLALEIPHKGGRTFGFRVSDPAGGALAYLSDHSPVSLGPGPHGFGPYHPAALELAAGVDVLIHDAQYTAEELPARASFGHSAVDYPVRLAEAAGARSVLLFHHDPARTDDEVEALAASLACRSEVPVAAAVEGAVLELA
jgi:ribonuclease BN (tRNA processing enzyme)